ncbi:hypothetical protein Nepgr_031983 [Nepenthes gracilis]|uniref:RRM domain-containing protein n=1 Tax=Nepenthes gracilis TaxID=150966 RepID=A0AAD3THR1_NEPGR|nr:hypothetical protein Nepgr_031983 [Nepenthes gracilis]
MEDSNIDQDEKRKHAELLSLPPHGSEVFLGGIPPDATEEDLRGFCENVGEVIEVRIMKSKDADENKGYAFVMFKTKELASKAMEKLNNAELKGKKIKCSSSQAKHKLFIGNVPKNWGKDDLKKVVKEIGPGIMSIELLKDPLNSNRNRGFAFIEYYNHACAEYSRQKMSTPRFKLGDNAPTVSWADPKNAESSATLQVKAIYVKNLPKDVNSDKLQDLFAHHGKISKVILPPAKPGQENSRFGFVHFVERSSAMKALKNTEKYELDGQVLECSLAKPQAEQKLSSGASNSHKPALLPRYPPHGVHGLVGGAYGPLSAGYAAPGLVQPLVFGSGPTPGGMAMMPMLLPDGRIGYVLQQPGMQHQAVAQPRTSGGRGGSSGGRKHGNEGSRGRSRFLTTLWWKTMFFHTSLSSGFDFVPTTG